MANYPTANGYDIVRSGTETDAPAYLYQDNRIGLQMHWPAGKSSATPAERQARISKVVTRYNGVPYLLPAVRPNDRPLHPLLTWWAILFALSMLARYQSAEWSEYIDVDGSQYAVSLEDILTDALVTVPALIFETIHPF
jgi:YaaC-like Protein